MLPIRHEITTAFTKRLQMHVFAYVCMCMCVCMRQRIAPTISEVYSEVWFQTSECLHEAPRTPTNLLPWSMDARMCRFAGCVESAKHGARLWYMPLARRHGAAVLLECMWWKSVITRTSSGAVYVLEQMLASSEAIRALWKKQNQISIHTHTHTHTHKTHTHTRVHNAYNQTYSNQKQQHAIPVKYSHLYIHIYIVSRKM